MKKSQEDRVLKALQDANGEWISGRYFSETMKLTQFHRALFNLKKRDYKIQSSDFIDKYGFKSHRLEKKGGKETVMFNKAGNLKITKLPPKQGPLFNFKKQINL